jgi:acyl-CoA oxidase
MNLYMQTIKNLGTAKHLKYLQRGATLEDIGSFSMTELSHGSDVQSIKTTATYDASTKEFILNTPTQNDMKFWIGSLAKTATNTIVFA